MLATTTDTRCALAGGKSFIKSEKSIINKHKEQIVFDKQNEKKAIEINEWNAMNQIKNFVVP